VIEITGLNQRTPGAPLLAFSARSGGFSLAAEVNPVPTADSPVLRRDRPPLGWRIDHGFPRFSLFLFFISSLAQKHFNL
jgi:hypothetical protein